MARSRSGVLVALLALSASLAAQEPPERAALDSIRDSFRSVTDSGSLIARERERVAVARVDRDNPMIHMELGYLAYRLGELTGARRRYEDAASEFQWAADLRAGWPYAWYWLGLAELATGESSNIVVENIRQWLGMDFLSRAASAFARAVAADPSFARGLVDLATTALRQRIAPRLLVAQNALRLAAATPAAESPEVQLVRGRVERRLGANDSALAAFRAFVAVGGDSAQGGVEIARTLALLGRNDSSAAAYSAAVARPLSDSARREVRRDLRWIAVPEELAAYDSLPADSLGPWLTRFWEGREVADGRRPGERLTEQFRRYQYAVDNFQLVTRRRAFDPSFVYRDTTQSQIDDRGVIYLRHGEPDLRAQYNAPGIEPNESWLYHRRPPQRDLVFHFVARGDVQDYRLIETLADVLGSGPAVGLAASLEGSGLATGPFVNLYASRSGFGPIYELLSRGGTVARTQLLTEERIAGRAMVREGTSTDSYALRFASDLRPVVSVFTMADASLRPELHVVFALPALRLHALDASGSPAYALEMRVLAYDSTRRRVAALDTLRVFRSARALGEGAFLTEQVAVPVRPGMLHWTFVVEEVRAGGGASVANQPLEVPRFDEGFGASDVIAGREGSGLVWRRPEGEIPLNPLMRFPREGAIALYYELYGLPQGARVGTRIRIVRRGGRSPLRRLFGGGGGADLAYMTVTDAPARVRVRQRLDLSGLAPGRYALELELTDESSGRRVVRRASFEIEGAP